MNKEAIMALAMQVMIFRNTLFENGADEKTANTLTSYYIQFCLAIATQGR